MAAGGTDRARAARPRHHRDASARSRCASGTSHITMAHGAGGKATQTLIEGLLVPAFASPHARDARRRRDGLGRGAELALTTDSFVVKPIRFPGGSIGELAVNGTVNDLAVAGARPLALTLSLVLEEGLAADELRAEVEAIAAAAAEAGVRDRRRRHEGRRARPLRLDVPLHRRDRARSTRARASRRRRSRPGRPDPRLGLDRRARHGDHARPRRVRARRRDRVGHPLALAGRRRAARRRGLEPPLHARRDARRRRLGAERARPRLAASRWSSARPTSRSRRPSPGPPRSSGSTRCTSPTRASSSPSSRPSAPTAALAALRARARAASEAAEIGEVKTDPPGMVLVRPRSAARRVMDQLVGDPLPRIC